MYYLSFTGHLSYPVACQFRWRVPLLSPGTYHTFRLRRRLVEPFDVPTKMKILPPHRIPFRTGTYIRPFNFKIINLHSPFSTGPCLSAPKAAQKKDRRISLCFFAYPYCPSLADHVLAPLPKPSFGTISLIPLPPAR